MALRCIMISSTPHLVLAGTEASRFRHHLDRHMTTRWNVSQWTVGDAVTDLDQMMATATAVVVGPDAVRAGQVLPQLKVNESLRLVQLPFAGSDFLDPEWLPHGCIVANSTGHESAIAEFVLAVMLEWVIGRRAIEDDFRSGSWHYQGSRPGALVHGELRGRTLGLVGWGGIAQEVAGRAAAFSMDIMAVGRSPRSARPPLRWYGRTNQIDQLMDEADIVVVACDLNEGTRGLIGGPQLERLGSEGFLVNVSRGPIVVEDALYQHLAEGRLGGAAIDVWYGYPTPDDPDRAPSRHPFASLDNVMMSPHCSGRTDQALARRWHTVAANLDRLARNEPIPTMVAEGRRSPSA